MVKLYVYTEENQLATATAGIIAPSEAFSVLTFLYCHLLFNLSFRLCINVVSSPCMIIDDSDQKLYSTGFKS